MSTTPSELRDALGRALRSLRLSVTDRCNLRCQYCMPGEEYTWLPRADLLSFEELTRLVACFVRLGVRRLRLTGGEPLLRRDLAQLVARLRALPGVEDLALTTNGLLLPAQAAELRAAGLSRVTLSLDSLREQTFRELTRRDSLHKTLAGVEAALAAGFPVKLNTVVIRGVNDEELVELLSFARERGVELRLIEYMDVGGATEWSHAHVVSQAEILARLEAAFGPCQPEAGRGSSPAAHFRLADGTRFGVIASTTQPFCQSCDRTRVTADGRLFTCLYGRTGYDLREPLRAGASEAELEALLRELWGARRDRGAEERRKLGRRMPLAAPTELRADPHLEMHTRGG